MTDQETEAKLAELERLLNDPEVRMDPHRVWTLLAELSTRQPIESAASRPSTEPRASMR